MNTPRPVVLAEVPFVRFRTFGCVNVDNDGSRSRPRSRSRPSLGSARSLRILIAAELIDVRCQVGSAPLVTGKRWQRAVEEQQLQSGDRIGDVDVARIVEVGGVEAAEREALGKEIEEGQDRVRDVQVAAAVGVAPPEPEAGRRERLHRTGRRAVRVFGDSLPSIHRAPLNFYGDDGREVEGSDVDGDGIRRLLDRFVPRDLPEEDVAPGRRQPNQDGVERNSQGSVLWQWELGLFRRKKESSTSTPEPDWMNQIDLPPTRRATSLRLIETLQRQEIHPRPHSDALSPDLHSTDVLWGTIVDFLDGRARLLRPAGNP